MRRVALISIAFVVFGYAANAQFSLTPKFGVEQSRTTINYNDLASFSPLGSTFSPLTALRLDYKFKNIHGPFVGISSNKSLVSFQFSNPETAMTDYEATKGDRQHRVDVGYQVSTKPIYFKKSNSASKTPAVQSKPPEAKKSCGSSYVKSRCGSSSKGTEVAKADKLKDERWNMRIQPFAGMAFVTDTEEDFEDESQGSFAKYEYNAGNWNTAVIAGTDFEFGKGSERKFVVGIQWLKGIGNLDEQTLTTDAGTKITNTTFSSKVSNWNLTLGIPFTLGKKQKEVKQVATPKTVEPKASTTPKATTPKAQQLRKPCSYYFQYKCRSRTI
jgi:hypothetical protein